MNITHITKRLVIPLARRGNIGKSTFVSAVAQWYDHHSVDWRGYDADVDHQSFSRLFPDSVALTPIGEEPEGDFLSILRKCAEQVVAVVDPRAHLSDVILRTMDMIRFTDSFAEAGGRVTAALFPCDDLEVMSDIDSTVERLGNSVDYLIVRNRARAQRTRMFDDSELQSELMRLGVVELEIPVLLSAARNHIAAHEARLQRGVTHIEAMGNRELGIDPLIRLAIRDWLSGLFRRFDGLATCLLPDSLAASITRQEVRQSVAIPARRGGRINSRDL